MSLMEPRNSIFQFDLISDDFFEVRTPIGLQWLQPGDMPFIILFIHFYCIWLSSISVLNHISISIILFSINILIHQFSKPTPLSYRDIPKYHSSKHFSLSLTPPYDPYLKPYQAFEFLTPYSWWLGLTFSLHFYSFFHKSVADWHFPVIFFIIFPSSFWFSFWVAGPYPLGVFHSIYSLHF